ncbi:hypothetical protein GALL_545040 [mine drainage metagenome]|uniref:Uncharacterized protein n=1 Tax=mine drainage metagenome TaxID=410659 RepID=A0A1J5PK87_9ZZZZ
MVAESTEIFAPMLQLGCAQASCGVTASRVCAARWRNGPPDAVSTILRTSAFQRERSAGRLCRTALCSLSMGIRSPPPFSSACNSRSPATTSDSLLASSRRLPERAAARLAASPAAPTMAAMTWSTSPAEATASSDCAPVKTSVELPLDRRRLCSCSAACGSVSTA